MLAQACYKPSESILVLNTVPILCCDCFSARTLFLVDF